MSEQKVWMLSDGNQVTVGDKVIGIGGDNPDWEARDVVCTITDDYQTPDFAFECLIMGKEVDECLTVKTPDGVKAAGGIENFVKAE